MDLRKNNKGFSLIELMVVVSIIGILSVIAVTALNSARDRSRASAALSTASGVVPAISLCVESARTLQDEGMQEVTPGTGVPENENVCKETNVEDALWPELPTRYVYGESDDGSDTSNPDDWYFTIESQADDNKVRVACDESGCKDCKESPTLGKCADFFPSGNWD